ncbi:hypothetical protein CBS101457_006963 [Exobasidium rhododendri]|nr:hypothetical protein CBS101457_006963 [Exobasidium rhododendri]
MLGWLLVALSAMLGSERLIWASILILGMGVGGNATIQAFAINILESGLDNDNGRNEETPGMVDETVIMEDSERKQIVLDTYLGLLGFLESVVSILAPLLDGSIYGATLSLAPYVIYLWAAAQYAACAILIISL